MADITFPVNRRTIPPGMVWNFLDRTDGKIFSVTFVKKTDGEVRHMNCRMGVKKHLKGGKSTIADIPSLVSVYDLKHNGYRCFDVNRVIALNGAGLSLVAD